VLQLRLTLWLQLQPQLILKLVLRLEMVEGLQLRLI